MIKTKKYIKFDLQQFKDWFNDIAPVISDHKTREECNPSEGRVNHDLDEQSGDIVEKWTYWFGDAKPDSGEAIKVKGEIIDH
jgi:hypothetical protein